MASSAVNRPTNVQQKEQDVNNKLRLYGIYSAFSKGKVPSNKQIDITLNSALESKALSSPPEKLSDEGKALVADLRDVIQKAKLLFLTKNEGNLLQDFIWQSQQLSGGNAKLPNSPVDKETAQQHGQEALEGLRTLGTLLLSNGQFRKLLTDASVLLRDVAGDAAQNAATRLNPSEERLSQIDQPAADNTWHDVPSVSDLKGKANDLYNTNKPFSKSDAKAAANQGANTALDAAPDSQVGSKSDTAQHAGNAAGQGKDVAVSNLVDTAKTNVPDETQENIKSTAAATRDQARAYFGKKMPKERRDQTIWRLKKMIVEIQGHEDYSQAVETLLSLAETYGGHGGNVARQSAGTVQGAHSDDALKTAEADLKTLIERFANSTSMDDLFDAVNLIYQDAQSDPELKNWFKSVDSYIRKCLQQQGYVIQDASTEDGRRLYDQGQFLLRERYRDHTNRLLDEFKFLASQFEEDPQNKAFAAAVEKLFLDLGNDEHGKPVFKKHLVTDLTSVILPGFFESIRYVPIPRIEVSDPQIDAIIENLVIESDNLMPNMFEITSDNYFRWGRKSVTSQNKNKIIVAVSGVQLDLRDVAFYVKRKEGFPSITDKGVMDLFMGGEGLSFKIGLETADKSDKAHFFKVNTVHADVKHLKIKVKQSNHKLLFAIAKPLLMTVIKPAVMKALEKQLRQVVSDADAYCYSIHQDAEAGLQDAKDDPENAPNVFARYTDAIKKRITEDKQRKENAAKDKTKDSKAKVAMTANDSLFPDIKLPGGISSKATEYENEAKSGDKWESPVFGLGSAKESTDIPKVAQISRKPHNVAQASLNSTSQPTGTVNPASSTTETTGFSNHVDQAFAGNSTARPVQATV